MFLFMKIFTQPRKNTLITLWVTHLVSIYLKALISVKMCKPSLNDIVVERMKN